MAENALAGPMGILGGRAVTRSLQRAWGIIDKMPTFSSASIRDTNKQLLCAAQRFFLGVYVPSWREATYHREHRGKEGVSFKFVANTNVFSPLFSVASVLSVVPPLPYVRTRLRFLLGELCKLLCDGVLRCEECRHSWKEKRSIEPPWVAGNARAGFICG